MEMTKIPGEKKLRPICKALGVSQKGSKNDLLHRLTLSGLSMQEILFRANNVASPNKHRNLPEELQSLRRQSGFYGTVLPTSIDDVPSENSLRTLSKRFGLKQFGNKVDLLKSLVDHGLSFGDIVNMSGHTAPFFAGALSPLRSSHKDDDVMDVLPPPLSICEEEPLPLPSSIVCDIDILPVSTEQTLPVELAPASSSSASVVCNVCGKSFARKRYLNVHMATHDPSQCLQCPVCGKSFAQKRYLKAHMAYHDLSQCVQCPVCGILIPQNLNRHMKTHVVVHPNDFGGHVSHCI